MTNKKSEKDLLEDIEWISLRWHNAPNDDMPRILLIGDSIVAGHGARVHQLLKDTMCVDFFATSKHITHSEYMSDLEFMLSKRDYALILFNNGLHGFGVSDELYKPALTEVLTYLKTKTSNLCWRNSTPVLSSDLNGFNSERNPRVIRRNSDADEVANRLGLPVLDLYTPMADKKNLFSSDAVHFKEEGQQLQAELIAEFIKGLLGC